MRIQIEQLRKQEKVRLLQFGHSGIRFLIFLGFRKGVLTFWWMVFAVMVDVVVLVLSICRKWEVFDLRAGPRDLLADERQRLTKENCGNRHHHNQANMDFGCRNM